MSRNTNNNENSKQYLRRKEALTSFFSDNSYSPMNIKQIARIFGVKKKELNELEEVLNDLIGNEVIYVDNNNRYVLIDGENVIKCVYQSKGKNFGFGLVENGEDIYIDKHMANGAMNTDVVLVKLFDKDCHLHCKKIEGEIVKIIKRNVQKVVGRYIKSRNFGFVTPIDQKLDDIYIPKKYSKNIKDGQVVELKINKYATSSSKAEGEIIRIIDGEDSSEVEVKALYISYGLDVLEKFPSFVEKEIKNIPDTVDNKELGKRIDRISDNNIYTIDSADAKDLDDAVQVKKEGDKYILSVYIADVSHYVKDGTNLDNEAIKRGTSIYIPGRVIPMLPKKLSNGICSLNQGVKRLCLAIDITFDKYGNVLESNVFKSVIKVRKKMTYENVYKVLNHQDEKVLEEYKDFEKDILLMKELALILNEKRTKNGSINFDIPETKILLDENGKVAYVKPYEITVANKIIEEFMLAANMEIAEKYYFLELPFIYRIHEVPAEEKLRDLNELLSNYKKRIRGIKNIHPKTLANILDEITDEEEKKIVSTFMLRTLKLARYSDECIGHFGLAAKYYCHFTSPIRRYPDLFIHRVISDYIDSGYNLSEDKIKKYKNNAKRYSDTSSEAEKQATQIERDFDKLYETIYMKKYEKEEFDGFVSSITSFGMFVKLENTVEGFVSFDNLGSNEYYIYDEVKRRLIGERTGKIYKIGDKVKVKLIKADVKLKQIDFTII